MVKKLSKAKVIIITLVAALILAAVGSVVIFNNKAKASSVQRTYDGCEKVYVNLSACENSWWTDAGCYHRVYFFGPNNAQAWATLTETTDRGIYGATVPAGTYTHLIFVRTSTEDSTWSNGQVYNQTGDIPLDSSKNYVSAFGGEGKTNATWSNYGTVTTTTTPVVTSSPSADKVYVNLGACGNSWWLDAGCYHKVYMWGNNVEAWANLTETTDSGVYSFGMPAGTYTGIIICRTSTADTTWTNGEVYNKTGDIEFNSNYNYISSFEGQGSSKATWANYGSTPATVAPTATATTTPATVAPTATATTTPATVAPTATATATPTSNPSNDLADNIQDGVILHAFNWSYNTIKNNMADIAAAGYTAVQTSPVQQPKDYSASYTDVSGQWWKLYQPVSFSVAEKSWLGSKQDLINLCDEADKYGVKIVCDIVSNHLGGNTSTTDMHPWIATYEPTIYNNYNTYFHSYHSCSDSNVADVVLGNIGMPDLNTSNSYIQERALSLLKECIDCGVDGFRFDAAKHIETPDDGYLASNYWPNVVGNAKTYAKSSKGIDLYVYGEILNTVGGGRSPSSYTKYISITDNKASDVVLGNVNSSNAAGASSFYYYTEQAANKLVLWNESHDTYMGNSGTYSGLSNTKGVGTTNINKAWAIIASRADAAGLYLARPSSTMGQAGNSAWKNTEAAKVNFFHNHFVGASEWLSNSGNLVMNERYFTKGASNGGAVIVNVSGTSQYVDMTVNTLGNGTYTDKITGNEFTVSNGKISGQIGSTGVAVIY